MKDSLTLQIRYQPPSGPRLVRDYLAGEEGASAFFAGSPYRLDTFRAKLKEVQGRFGRPERERAARALRPTSDRARARLERFVNEGGAMVTTGQQAGLLSGPLYTVYKAITAVRLAGALEERLGVVVVPVFWTASEDHDWAEVNHAFLPLERDGVRRVELPGTPERPTPMSDYPLSEGVLPILDEIAQVLDADPHAAPVLKWVRDAYRPGQPVSTAFTELMEKLLAAHDVCITEASDPVVKEGSVAVLERALRHGAEHERLLATRTGEIEGRGYRSQVAVLEGATNVFYHGAAGRERLYHRGEGFVTHESRTELDAAAVARELRALPGRFSPNVLLRPVVESAVFPTLAYVGGPGELSYFAQLSALFPEFGMAPPVAYPRASLLLLELPIQRLLEKLGVPLEELARPRHELIEELAQGSIPPGIRGTLDELSRAITEGYRRLIEEAIPIDPTLEGALARLRNEALVRVGESERKLTQHIKRKEAVRISQLDRLLDHLRPGGEPQERVLNVVPYLTRHGVELLDRIAEAIPVELR